MKRMKAVLVLQLIPAAFSFAAYADKLTPLRLAGSSTVFPFASSIAEHVGQGGSQPTPIVESIGTGAGIERFCRGLDRANPDIATASRRIEAGELESCHKNGVKQVSEITLGLDGIVIAGHKGGPAYALTRAQVWKALAKQVPVEGKLVDNPYKNWHDIDAAFPAEPISIMGPPPSSGTRDAFNELLMDKGCKAALGDIKVDDPKKFCRTYREDGAYVEMGENDNLIIGRLKTNAHALGVFGYSYFDQNRDSIQPATLEGVLPDYEDISKGTYPLSRRLYFYAKPESVVAKQVIAYLTEATSDKAAGSEGYLAEKGLIALPKAELKAAAEAAKALTPLAGN